MACSKSNSANCRQNPSADSPDQTTSIELNEPVMLTFALRYLSSFTKATPLSPSVTIYMSKELPVVVEYRIADMGNIRQALVGLYYFACGRSSQVPFSMTLALSHQPLSVRDNLHCSITPSPFVNCHFKVFLGRHALHLCKPQKPLDHGCKFSESWNCLPQGNCQMKSSLSAASTWRQKLRTKRWMILRRFKCPVLILLRMSMNVAPEAIVRFLQSCLDVMMAIYTAQSLCKGREGKGFAALILPKPVKKL